MVDHTSEFLSDKVNYLHENLQEYHTAFAEDLAEILSAVQEIYVRDIIARGMAQYSGPIVDYYVNYNAQVTAAAEENDFWYNVYDEDVENMEIPFDAEGMVMKRYAH